MHTLIGATTIPRRTGWASTPGTGRAFALLGPPEDYRRSRECMKDDPPERPVVLIADDEVSVRRLVRTTIESEQYDLIEASDGQQAWALLQEQRPQVALLDVQMPGRTGFDLVRAIRADTILAGMKVILLTGRAQAEDIQKGESAGTDLYLTKPFSPLELLEAVEQALGLG